ncbi:NAD-dependent epimerase/dehydratase family protein [Streptomyces liangshanensis]|uniref:NAD-dependent epimerase/dehydratase family protein n=1 Tax=Streptomyces liangshanensis TaxID=2717324 RepID=A0A6G9GYC3_9ACTN|nr:NAD-dependent epimerase/dehydratase family protein [Streptomyces liangshanensis]QIQ03282.1 NAD-dependent epimerase/dehydratase family protein [Streptomyces liangshanensis]
MSTPRHVIFGTGAIGRATLAALLRRGERPQDVRMVNRSGSAPVPDGVEVAAGDATDPAFTTAVAEGAQVVYQVLNPPYHRWAEEFPGLQAGVVAAAEAAGARLVSMDNVYMYGPPLGRPLTEGHADAPTTRKGAVRARMAQDLLAAHRAGRVEVTVGRASDYFGPGGGKQSVLGDTVFAPALRGRAATVLGDPDQPHTYTYIPDIGEGLALLGEHPDAAGEVWHLPNDPVTRTTRQLVALVQEAAGHPKAKVRALPPVVMRALGVANPLMRELTEMLYEFQEPFVVDSTKITKHLGATATPAERAVADTLATYRTS